jgi:thymidine kinase
MAKLTAVYGPMFAGKTTWIIEKIRQLETDGTKCLVFKPRLDDRYGKEAKLHAHGGAVAPTFLINENAPEEMLSVWAQHNEVHQTVVIDEVMFFSPQVVEVVKEMLARELSVIVAGLDTNFRKEPFGVMPKLIRLANEKRQLYAVCYKCGKQAAYSARLQGGTADIAVGSSELYQPACVNCHTIYHDGGVDFPNLRPLRKGPGIRIEIGADSMRVGKTTAVRVIAEGLRREGHQVVESYEDWQHNPYLAKSYEDPAKNFLDSQKWFIKRKWEQVKDGYLTQGVFIQDVAPETDYCYAATNLRLGRMSRKHFEEYEQYFKGLDWEKAPKPDLLIYLTVSDEKLLARANASKREFETVEPDYFLTMKQVNREWLRKSSGDTTIIEVDTDSLDYANDESAKQKLVEMIIHSGKFG